jgi:hypothetical protein
MNKLYIFKRNKLSEIIYDIDKCNLCNYLWHGNIKGVVVDENGKVVMWHKKALPLYEKIKKDYEEE